MKPPQSQPRRNSMKVRNWKLAAIAAMTIAILAITGWRPSLAQTPPSRGITLYEDLKSGALYRKPGRGRVAVTLGLDEPATPPPAIAREQVQQQIKQNNDELRAEFQANQQKLAQENADLQVRVNKIEPATLDYLDSFKDRVRFGTLVYGGYKLYTHTGFGPQQFDNNSTLGPGNNLYNSFDLDRAYLNFYFNPTPDWTFRVTPDIYRALGAATPASTSHNSALGSNLSGDISYRIKYAYLEYNKILDWAGPATKGSTIQIGSISNPFVSWEEDLTTFRYVTASPWNYAGLTSAQLGLAISGPIKYGERTFIDYGLAALDNSKYNQFEESDTKQFIGRVSYYPFGSAWRFQGLGITGFYDYGYNNNSPDMGSLNTGFGPSTTTFGHVNNAHLTRWAALLHYTAETWGIAAEYDQGHNSFTATNLFSGNGPSVFFTPPASASSAGGTTTPYTVPYYNFSALSAALLNNSRTVQQGFDVFGHVQIPETPFRLLGLFQFFEPNTHVNSDPFDFYRYMVGVEWQVNEFIRIAIDTQNLNFYHDQTPFSTAYANKFGDVFIPVKDTATGAAKGATFAPPKTVSDPVPRDTHAIELNMEFAF